MYATDFEYDGKRLSDMNFIVCNFNNPGLNIVDVGSKITFNKVSMHGGKKYGLASTKYESCLQTTFDICKNPCNGEQEITNNEYKELMRWLNRREFLTFKIFDKANEGCFYKGSFNIDEIKINDVLYGLRLTLETDSPFGYGETQTVKFTLNTERDKYIISDISDEIGCVHPNVTIVCKANGTLLLENQEQKTYTAIANCQNGETITIYGDTQIITTSNPAHSIANDFNYEFPKIGNTINNRTNTFTSKLACEVTISYVPIVKNII